MVKFPEFAPCLVVLEKVSLLAKYLEIEVLHIHS